MMPPPRSFEKVAVDEWINGEITEIMYEMKHAFKTSEGPAVRIKITLDGYKFPKATPWMLFSYSKKSNLFILFIEPLVEGAYEYMEFDLDQIKNMKVKVMFEQKGEYQNILRIRPIDGKVKPVPVTKEPIQEHDAAEPVSVDEEIPF